MTPPGIYLDYQAATPVDPRVLQRMLPFFSSAFGNAASRTHAFGWDADRAVGEARLRILELIGAKSPDEIVFTSGATESNNLALRGVLESAGGGHVITSAIEHPCVLETCRYLTGSGVEHTEVGVDADGRVSPSDIEAAIRPHTVLISVMAVNNEIGTVQPIAEVGAVARRHGVLFHTDAAQAVGRIPLDVQRDGIDLLSMSAHKMYGPKGVGALYVSGHPRRTAVTKQMHGGGHERGRRSGTLNVPGIVGFGEAARLARQEREAEMARLGAWRDRLLAVLQQQVPRLRVYGSMKHRVACNLNVSFDGIRGDTFLSGVPGLALSGGAACASGKADASHVLSAMGVSRAEANCAVRIALGRMTTEREVELASRKLVAAARRLSHRR